MALVSMTLAASDVALTVDPATPCVQQPALVRALLARSLRVRASSDALEVQVTPAPDGLQVVGRRKERRFQRRVPAEPSACAAVERIVVSLIDSWANTPPQRAETKSLVAADAGTAEAASRIPTDAGSAAVDAPTDQPRASGARDGGDAGVPTQGEAAVGGSTRAVVGEPTPDARSARDAGAAREASSASPLPDASAGREALAGPSSRGSPGREAPGAGLSSGAGVGREALSAGPLPDASNTREAAASPPDAGVPARRASREGEARSLPEGDEAPSALDAGALTAAVSATDGGLASAEGTALPFNLEVGVLGGGTIDGAGLATGAGSALVRAGIGRWGLLVDVGLESARSAEVERVTVSAPQQWLSAAFSVAFAPLDSLRLDLALGARGWRTDATAEGLDDRTGEGLTFTIGGVLSAGAAWRVTGPLFLTARAFASVRSVELKLKVEPYGDVLSLNPWIYGLQGGVLVRFE